MVEEKLLFYLRYLAYRAMPAPYTTSSYSRISCIAKSTILVATLASTCAATVPTPPSADDKWLYPDINTLPTYNYLDTINASWTSNFRAPYLLLRCQHPNDAVHYAYRKPSRPPTGTPLISNSVVQRTISPSQQPVLISFPSMMEVPGYATSKCPTSAPLAQPHPRSSATISTS